MLIETPGGFDYTVAPTALAGCARPASESARVEHLIGPDSMVIGIK